MKKSTTVDWTCKCGHVNGIKVPCVLPKKLTCEKCGMNYWTFQHIIKYIGDTGDMIEILRDIGQF